MLKAWEAMRLSKDAQIAALMDRCKRYDEDAAEKGRSLEALRRKLAHHSTASAPSTLSTSSLATSVTGVPSEAGTTRAAGTARHVHLHMHGPSHPPEGSGSFGSRQRDADGSRASVSSVVSVGGYERHHAAGSDAVNSTNSYLRQFL
jgi:hypothetical protein